MPAATGASASSFLRAAVRPNGQIAPHPLAFGCASASSDLRWMKGSAAERERRKAGSLSISCDTRPTEPIPKRAKSEEENEEEEEDAEEKEGWQAQGRRRAQSGQRRRRRSRRQCGHTPRQGCDGCFQHFDPSSSHSIASSIVDSIRKHSQ